MADPELIGMGDLKEMVAPLRHTLEQGEAHERHLRDLANQQRDENTKMRRALTVVDPDYHHPNSKSAKKRKVRQPGHVGVPRTNGTATGFGITIERALDYSKEILKQIDKGAEFVTQPGIYKKVKGGDQTKASAAFRWFREIGFLRKAGREPETKRERWAVMDRDAIDKAIAETQREAVNA